MRNEPLFTERRAIQQRLSEIANERRELTKEYHQLVNRLRELDEHDTQANESAINNLAHDVQTLLSKLDSKSVRTDYTTQTNRERNRFGSNHVQIQPKISTSEKNTDKPVKANVEKRPVKIKDLYYQSTTFKSETAGSGSESMKDRELKEKANRIKLLKARGNSVSSRDLFPLIEDILLKKGRPMKAQEIKRELKKLYGLEWVNIYNHVNQATKNNKLKRVAHGMFYVIDKEKEKAEEDKQN
jgi:hypothetical protein